MNRFQRALNLGALVLALSGCATTTNHTINYYLNEDKSKYVRFINKGDDDSLEKIAYIEGNAEVELDKNSKEFQEWKKVYFVLRNHYKQLRMEANAHLN